jgi:hypothetical protein
VLAGLKSVGARRQPGCADENEQCRRKLELAGHQSFSIEIGEAITDYAALIPDLRRASWYPCFRNPFEPLPSALLAV